jgi:hypothetical protein
MNKKKWALTASGIALLVIFLLGRNLFQRDGQQPNVIPIGDVSVDTATEETAPTETAGSGGATPSTGYTTPLDTSAQDHAEQRAALLEKLEPLFGSKEKGRGILYGMVVDTLDKESVPFLRELLQDESYKDRWGAIATMIAWLSDKNDKDSVTAILDYIRRPNTWPADDRDSIIGHTVKKGGVLKNLGHLESDLVRKTLQDALTEEGAEDLISAWINVQKSAEPPQLVMIIRSGAARGLALTQDPASVTLLKESYETLAHKMLTVEYREKEMTSELWLESELLLAYAGGMVENDMLADMGMEEFVRLRDSGHTWAMVRSPYLFKYLGEKLGDERRIMNECPICGKAAE